MGFGGGSSEIDLSAGERLGSAGAMQYFGLPLKMLIGCRVWRLGFRVSCRVWGLGFRVSCRVWGLGFRVSCRV